MYDFAVVGLGAIGGAAALALAERGHSVVGFDRFRPPHAMGSSHGDTRLLREVPYQGSPYLPLLRRAEEGWRRLETGSGRTLLRRTGALAIGPPGGRTHGGTLEAALRAGPDYEELSPADAARRFPAFRLEPGTIAVFEPRAGVFAAEACVETLLERAAVAGADLRFDEPLRRWSVGGGAVTIDTDHGGYRARRLALAAGAWTSELAAEATLPLVVERTVQHWFEPAADPTLFDPERCPPWVWEYGTETTWYGFPRTERGIKVGMHVQAGRAAAVDRVRRSVGEEEERDMRRVLERFMPDAAGSCVGSSVCMYTNTPDRDFILDRHPVHPEIALFAGGSGHAFKFAPALGEALADLLTDRPPAFDTAAFSLRRVADQPA